MNTIILIGIVFFFALISILWLLAIEMRLKKIFRGVKVKNLEEMIVSINKKMLEIEENQKNINDHLKIVDSRLDKTIRDIKIIRFNPFTEAGGNQSFAISFLNDKGDGVILSSLYARERMSVFAKPIVKGKSEFDLSEEEDHVLQKSLNK